MLSVELTFPNSQVLETEIIALTHLEKYLAHFDCCCNIKIMCKSTDRSHYPESKDFSRERFSKFVNICK